MKIRLKNYPNLQGTANKFNMHGLGEVEGNIGRDYDLFFIDDLDVFIEAKQEWKCMTEAFRDKDIIPDNYNSHFAEPRTQEEKEQGYYD